MTARWLRLRCSQRKEVLDEGINEKLPSPFTLRVGCEAVCRVLRRVRRGDDRVAAEGGGTGSVPDRGDGGRVGGPGDRIDVDRNGLPGWPVGCQLASQTPTRGSGVVPDLPTPNRSGLNRIRCSEAPA